MTSTALIAVFFLLGLATFSLGESILDCDAHCKQMGYGGGNCEGSAPFCEGECVPGTINVGNCDWGCISGQHACCCSKKAPAMIKAASSAKKASVTAHAIAAVADRLGKSEAEVGGHFVDCHGDNACLARALPGINKCWWTCSAVACKNGGTVVCTACKAMCPPEDIKNCLKECNA